MNAAKTFQGFDDLGEEFETSSASGLPETIEDASRNKSTRKVVGEGMFIEKCDKCRGTGSYHFHSSIGSHCTKCQGSGKLYFKTSKQQRENARKMASNRKLNKLVAKQIAFQEANPEVIEWWTNTEYHFALSLRDAFEKYGELTERQLAAAKKAVASLAAAKAERAAQVEVQKVTNKVDLSSAAKAERAAQVEVQKVTNKVDLSSATAAIDKAREKGIKNPKLRLAFGEWGQLVLYRAPDHSINAGSYYVKSTAGDYLGKVSQGVYFKSRDVHANDEADILQALRTPLESAVAFGRRTGSCSCCGRELTNGESIELGIGPICREKFFM